MFAVGQGQAVEKPAAPSSAQKFQAEIDFAKLALAAHGGDKFKMMKTLVIRGSVDVTTSGFGQSIPATFVTVFAGEKYRMEIANPFQPLKQVFNGTETLSSMRGGFTLPPINRLGLALLPRLGDQGFVITAVANSKKGQKAFRMTSPEGYFTDFFLDEKTNRIKSYTSNYTLRERAVSTSVEIDKFQEVNGIVIPEKYAQRFDMDQLTVYAVFKAKEILVDTKLADDVFEM